MGDIGDGIWALVNNASALGSIAHADALTKDDFERVLDVNLLGMVDTTRAFLPLVRKARGRIVNISSVNGRLGFLFTPFSVSKFGVEAFSDVLRQEVYRQGINVSIIEPGSVQTSEVGAESVLHRAQEATGKSDSETKVRHNTHIAGPLKHRLFYFFENRSSNVGSVIDAYTHAITAQVPRTRYVIGWDAKFITQSLCHLPDFLTDAVIRASMRTF
ncbi:retinol dehydrogenase 7 [Elysia marginata]|uniref:Retinol dehydrogenase 7 n=1 Tax=Elysia marginata TaxID=1093978 RepID=A0AAV4HV31_9GAST|nr:retinol dehydrogenase 7 [Elysia marginata]